MIGALFDRIQSWFDRTPKARRAYERLSADADAVVARLDASTRGSLRDAIEARIDPPRPTPTPLRPAVVIPDELDSEAPSGPPPH